MQSFAHLSHDEAIQIDFGHAIITLGPGDRKMMPDRIPLYNTGCVCAVESGVAALLVWIWPEVNVLEVMAGQDVAQVKDDKVVEVGYPLVLVCAVRIQRV